MEKEKDEGGRMKDEKNSARIFQKNLCFIRVHLRLF